MKDAYSFDRDDGGLDVELRARTAGRTTGSSSAAGSRRTPSQAESGMMGGSESIDFLAPSGSGENTLVTCENGDFAADLEIARGDSAGAGVPGRRSARRRRSRRRASRRSRRSRSSSAIDAAATSKAMPVDADDGTVVLALVRGDDRLEEAKLAAALGGDVRPATDEEIRAAFGADPRLARPGRLRRARSSPTRRCATGQFVAGANRDRLAPARRRGRARLRGPLRRHPRVRRRATAARTAAARSRFQTAIEVGHIFKLGTQVLGAARRDVPRRGRQGEAARHGQLRHRPRARDGGRGRAAPRRARDHLAGGDRAVRRARRRAARARGARRAGRARRWRPPGTTCCSTTATQRAGREVRGRRPDRHARSASPSARRRSRTARSTCATARPARSAVCTLADSGG